MRLAGLIVPDERWRWAVPVSTATNAVQPRGRLGMRRGLLLWLTMIPAAGGARSAACAGGTSTSTGVS
jgi:hypothetical protein